MSYVNQGLGAVDPNAGTYEDPNCPFYCWSVGNLLDMELFGQNCWPCHNVCPPGQSWDTTNNVCSGTPASSNALAIPTTTAGGSLTCPEGQSWNANDAQCENACPWGQSWNPATQQCQTGASDILQYVGIGLAILLGGVIVAKTI